MSLNDANDQSGLLRLPSLKVLSDYEEDGKLIIVVANNDLAALANYDIPVACGIVNVAEGYFATLKPKISAKNQLIAAMPIALPLKIHRKAESFQVVDSDGRSLAYVYFEDVPERRAMMKRLTEAEAREVAQRIARALSGDSG